MKNEKLYKQAIEIAADSDERFRKVFAVNGNIEDQERKELHRRLEVQPAAAAACAQSELVATLFGVSDERVNEDISEVLKHRQSQRLTLNP